MVLLGVSFIVVIGGVSIRVGVVRHGTGNSSRMIFAAVHPRLGVKEQGRNVKMSLFYNIVWNSDATTSYRGFRTKPVDGKIVMCHCIACLQAFAQIVRECTLRSFLI